MRSQGENLVIEKQLTSSRTEELMRSTISILLPTRGRRQLAEEFIAGASKLAGKPDLLEFVLYVDDDDTDSQSIAVDGVNIRMIVGNRISMGGCNTACLEHSSGEIIVVGNDDIEVKTKNWDQKIREAHQTFDDQIYLAYPNDLYKGKKLSAFPILPRDVLVQLANPFPEIYRGAFIDTHLMEIFIRLKQLGEDRILYLSDVIFEHKHFRTGKSEVDQTYAERDRFGDDMTFLSLNQVRKVSAEHIIKKIRRESLPEPFDYQDPAVLPTPDSILSALQTIGKIYLFDTDLPLRYRSKFFIYMLGRWCIQAIT